MALVEDTKGASVVAKYRFQLTRTKDKITVLGSKEWVKQFLGICDLQHLIKDLERKVRDLERTKRKEKIWKLLAEDGNPRSMRWLSYRMEEVWHQDLMELVEEGKLIVERHGPHKLFRLEDALRLVLSEGVHEGAETN